MDCGRNFRRRAVCRIYLSMKYFRVVEFTVTVRGKFTVDVRKVYGKCSENLR